MFVYHTQRVKNTPLSIRICWRLFYVLQRFIPARFILRFLLNLVWLLWRLSCEQTDILLREQKYAPGLDLLRPRNVEDAIDGCVKGDRVCDFGGGGGNITHALLQLGCDVVFSDIDPKVEAAALSRFGPSINFRVENPMRVVTGQTGNYDLIVMSHVLEHIEDPHEFLLTLSGVTKAIHIEVPDIASEPLNYVRELLGMRIYKDDDHIIEMSLEYLANLVSNSNFRITSIVSRDACLVVRAVSKTR